MSKGARRLFAALVLLASLGAAASAWGAQQVHILLYHRVGDARHPSTNVALDAFIQQMKHLAEGGFEVVTTGALESFLREGKPLPERAVVIQFDDGSTTTFNCGFESGAGVQDLRISGTKAVIRLDDFLRSRREDHAGAYEYRSGWVGREEVVVPEYDDPEPEAVVHDVRGDRDRLAADLSEHEGREIYRDGRVGHANL